ncbi:MAG: hypothetical protein DHS20C16_12900 [Phycisphaerae bacterium]|nr:MAG: hypothetical protein DHS20C16_12900 [Phycisphaerae bacterium]
MTELRFPKLDVVDSVPLPVTLIISCVEIGQAMWDTGLQICDRPGSGLIICEIRSSG